MIIVPLKLYLNILEIRRKSKAQQCLQIKRSASIYVPYYNIDYIYYLFINYMYKVY